MCFGPRHSSPRAPDADGRQSRSGLGCVFSPLLRPDLSLLMLGARGNCAVPRASSKDLVSRQIGRRGESLYADRRGESASEGRLPASPRDLDFAISGACDYVSGAYRVATKRH